jgi:hypothetical protein
MNKKINVPKYHKGGSKGWILDEDVEYYSTRYGHWVKLEKGYESDGATGAFDIKSSAWLIHDKLCEDMAWFDGTPCTRWQGSMVCSDILESEGRWFRKESWKYATYLPKVWANTKRILMFWK